MRRFIMKKFVGILVIALFLSSIDGRAFVANNNDDSFLQKNFKDINSSKDFINNESPYSEPDTTTITESKNKANKKSFVEIGTKKSKPSKSKMSVSSPKRLKK